MHVEIWSDVVCPFCYIGKHQFEEALKQFEHRDEVVITFKSFELDKKAPYDFDGDAYDMLVTKYGMSREQAIESNEGLKRNAAQLGIELNVDKAKITNSFDAHRLIHFAGANNKQKEMFEILHKAYFTDGLHIGDHEVLIELAAELGLDREAARSILESDTFAGHVRDDENEANNYGIAGVPFFLIDSKYAIPGAQGVESFVQALNNVYEIEYNH